MICLPAPAVVSPDPHLLATAGAFSSTTLAQWWASPTSPLLCDARGGGLSGSFSSSLGRSLPTPLTSERPSGEALS
jgi:hypothetical protein